MVTVTDINHLLLICDIEHYIREHNIERDCSIEELIAQLAKESDVPF